MQLSRTKTLAFSLLPNLFVTLLFYLILGHRRDYLGHYAAGYGGTLALTAVALAILPEQSFSRWSSWLILACNLICIAMGFGTECTVFRLAKFDEIDFCNQSLGAVLAGLSTIVIAAESKPEDASLRTLMIAGATFLVMGGYFAVT